MQPLVLISGLAVILGESGYRMIEPAIKNEVKARFDLDQQIGNLHFDEVTELAAKKYLSDVS